MPHIRCNWVDILFVTLLIRICYIGFKNGILPEFFRLSGLLSAFIFSFNNYTLVGHFFSTHTRWIGARPDIISFLVIFLFILFIFKILASAASLLLSGGGMSGLSRIIGLVLGFVRGFLMISLLHVLFVNGPFEYLSRSVEGRSFFGQYTSRPAPFVYETGIKFYPWRKIETPFVKLLEK
ncbi:CvpA family protein [Candidatus Omnitrophota bacterium]